MVYFITSFWRRAWRKLHSLEASTGRSALQSYVGYVTSLRTTVLSPPTDHKPLKEVFKNKGIDLVSHRIRKWVVALQEFDYTVVYMPGTLNLQADCLSRLCKSYSLDETDRECGSDDDDYFTSDEFDQDVKVCLVTNSIIQESEWRDELLKDVTLQKVIEQTKNGWGVKKHCEEGVVPFWQCENTVTLFTAEQDVAVQDKKQQPEENPLHQMQAACLTERLGPLNSALTDDVINNVSGPRLIDLGKDGSFIVYI
ncbi:hypothetical protein NDU88_003871 [Pleurodeles waltl]|uniref:Uncharacterized protein n=1 Tax=Pleurodeles waltl TaxID=8319 RepID=A0AAV7QGP4_PLEWA|nr:hypothetical protein NDU88_003871 [Pleurodeles waltl]